MLELAVLGSGSKGNSTLIRTARTALLVDAGLSARQIGLRLQESGSDAAELDGVLLTHEHGDHVRGLRVLNKRFPTPVLGNTATLGAAGQALGDTSEAWAFTTGEPFTWGDFTITSFPVSHDATEPVGYVLEAEGIRVGYATDLGKLTPEIAAMVRGCHIVVLEANHDVDMLWNGSYPWVIKKRIGGEHGHLANATGVEQVAAITEGDTTHLLLVHLSENNNEPALVHRLFFDALCKAGRTNVELTVTSQHRATATVRF